MMSSRGVMVALCAGMAVLAGSAPAAHAQGAGTDAAAQQRALFERGNKLYDEEQYAAAEQLYLEAWKIKRSFDLAGNLGAVELHLKKPREAAEHLSYAIREFPAGGKPAVRESLLKQLAEAQAQVGRVRVAVSRPGAEVLVDGRSIGYAPIADEIFVEPGKRVIEARLEGFGTARETIEAGQGTRHEVKLEVAREAPVVGPGVTGAPEGASGMQGGSSGPGQRGGPHPAQGDIEGGAVRQEPRWVIVGAGAAATAVLLGAGVVFTAVSNGKASDADALRGELSAGGSSVCRGPGAPADCGALQDLNDGSDTFRNLAVVGFVGAGIAGVATAAYALWPRKAASAGAVRVIPVAGQGAAGLVVGAKF